MGNEALHGSAQLQTSCSEMMSAVKMDPTCYQFSLYWFDFLTLQTDK